MTENSKPLIIAHRGGKFWQGENFSYIDEAVRNGADIIELDIRIKSGDYVIQHPFDKVQGLLSDALAKLGTGAIYLDLKDKRIDVNKLIDYVHSKCQNRIIVGTFNISILQSITDTTVIKNLHCAVPWGVIKRAKLAKADWINPICYIVTRKLAHIIQTAGFKLVPSGNFFFKKNEHFSNQLRLVKLGAYAISTHNVRKMRALLENLIV